MESGGLSKEQETLIKEKIKELYLAGKLNLGEVRELSQRYDLYTKAPSSLQTGLKKYKSDQLHKERWASFLTENTSLNKKSCYRYSHNQLIQLAKAFPPKYAGNIVTDFSGWVFSLYRSNPTQESLLRGKSGEIERQRLFNEHLKLKKSLDKPQHSDWEPDYIDPLDGKPDALIISDLVVNNKPLWGAPDYVFKHKSSGEVLIVDIKISDSEIPSDGWPNLRAQLWAYSHIDKYRSAPKVSLIGEIWGGNKPLTRRGAISWQRDDEQFNRENEELFALYSSLPNRLAN